MPLPRFQRYHAYQTDRHPPYSTQAWPIMPQDLAGDPLNAAVFDAAVAAASGTDYLFLIERRPLEGEAYDVRRITKRYWNDDDPAHRAGEYIAQSDSGSTPTHVYDHLCADADGAYLYNIAWQLGAGVGWHSRHDMTVLYQKRSPADLSVVSSWDISDIINDFDFAAAPCQNYPATGERVDWDVLGARLAPVAGHAYIMRRYLVWPAMDPNYCTVPRAQFGWDIIDVNLAAATFTVLIDMPPPAAGGNVAEYILPGLHATWADDGDSIWFVQKYVVSTAPWPHRTGLWHSHDGGATWSGPQVVMADAYLNPYDVATVDGQPLLISVIPFFNGVPAQPDWTGFYMHAFDLRSTDDPLYWYWGRHPGLPSWPPDPLHPRDKCETSADSDMWRYVHPYPNFARFTYHADPDLQRLILGGGYTKWTDSSPYHSPWWWSALDTPFTGDKAALWIFGPRVPGAADLNVIQDPADLVHIHCVGGDGLRQYRDRIDLVAAATPDVIGDYGVPGCARRADGSLRLLADAAGDVKDLQSTNDGVDWTDAGAIALLAGASRPSIHPLAVTERPQPPGGSGLLPTTYLLTIWKADDILIYRGTDAHTWTLVGTLAADVPAQKIDLLVWPDATLRAYYADGNAQIWSAKSSDQGLTWADPVAAITGCTNPSALILPHGEALVACWQGDQLMIARADDGETFGDLLNVRDAGAAEVPEHGAPHHVALARGLDGTIYLWFMDSDELHVATSTDSGTTWA